MTLTERFIEFNRWSPSRKTALLTGVSLPGLPVLWILCEMFWAGLPIVNMPLVRLTLGILTSAYLLSFLISLLAARSGRNAPWTPYVAVLLVGGSVAYTIYIFGIWTASAYALFPISVMVLTLWFDEKVGWFTVVTGFVVLAVASWLQLAGWIPFAPAILARVLDDQLNARWVVGGTLIVTLYFAVAFMLGVLVIAARRLQETRLVQAQRLIRRYVPSQIADAIVSGGATTTDRHERRNLTIFFSDVEGFTNASDELDPEQLAALLNEYLSEMATIADRHGATINQFVGDGIMIFFGAPTATNDTDHALRAVRMSMEMQRRMADLQQHWFKRGFRNPFRIRIGINTGYASVGDFGSQGRAVYSAIGIQTNLAARIQSHCEPGKVLISHSTWALAHEDIPCVEKGELQVKGIHYPIKVYEVASPA